jgi:hypothetical protein
MNTNTATEYRNLPLAVLTESAHQPAPYLRGFRPQGTGQQYSQPGRSLSLACAASHRPELRDHRWSQTFPRCADGRGTYGVDLILVDYARFEVP